MKTNFRFNLQRCCPTVHYQAISTADTACGSLALGMRVSKGEHHSRQASPEHQGSEADGRRPRHRKGILVSMQGSHRASKSALRKGPGTQNQRWLINISDFCNILSWVLIYNLQSMVWKYISKQQHLRNEETETHVAGLKNMKSEENTTWGLREK